MEIDYSGMYESFQLNSAAKHLADLRIQIAKLQIEYREAIEIAIEGNTSDDYDHIRDLEREHFEIMKSKANLEVSNEY